MDNQATPRTLGRISYYITKMGNSNKQGRRVIEMNVSEEEYLSLRQAVNCHDELVETLNSVLRDGQDNRVIDMETWNKVKKSLHKAQEE